MAEKVFKTGKEGSVSVQATTLNVTGWSGTDEVAELESTHSGSGGFYTTEAGPRKFSGTVNANWQEDQNPHADPPNVVAGQIVAIKLFVGPTADNIFYDFVEARIISVGPTSEVGGIVKYSFNFVNHGTFTIPTS